jgi:hypothetical protein
VNAQTFKRLDKYLRIYQCEYDYPFLSHKEIGEKTGIKRYSVSRYFVEMYEYSILHGPYICLKPAANHHQYVSFLKFCDPFNTYRQFKGFPAVISRRLSSGSWNLSLICENMMDFSLLKGYQQTVYQGVKGTTLLSKVAFINWDQSVEEISRVSSPEKKTRLYKEVGDLPWGNEEWTLFNHFKCNARKRKISALDGLNIRYSRYCKWMKHLPEFAEIYPAFYPYGSDNYFVLDFLFTSEYHEQLAEVLGMLPSTSIFFSMGKYLFARLSVLDNKQKDELLYLIGGLKQKGYYTACDSVLPVSAPQDTFADYDAPE